jgi:hypothetical protein
MCFNEGTQILCFRSKPGFKEEYIPIENLREGDLVKTYRHGYRKISMIGKGKMINDPENIWESMYISSRNGDTPFRDLVITGGHGVLCDNISPKETEALSQIYKGNIFKVDEKYLVFSNQSRFFKSLSNKNNYTYYHIVLESDGDDYRRFGIWANGLLTETTCINHFLQNNYTPL